MLCSAPLAPARPDTNAAAVASTVKSSTANVFCPRDTRRARMVSGASIGPNARTAAVQYDAVFAAICRRCVDRGRQRHAANEGGDFTTPHCVGDAKAGTASHRRPLSRPSRASLVRERVRRLCSVLRSARNCFSATPLLSLKQCEKFGFK